MRRKIAGFPPILTFLCASIASAAQTGMLYVKSDPAGAIVLVDGERCGTTPAFIRNVKPGDRVVELRLPDGQVRRELVTVEAGKIAKLNVRVSQEPASLTVISDPLEAIVSVDRRGRGTTPVTVERLEPGPHEVIVHKEGYEKVVNNVELQPGETHVLEVRLRPRGAGRGPDEPAPELAALDEAEERIAGVLEMFEALIGDGDYAGARKLAEDKARRRDLADVAAKLRVAARVARALEARQEAIRKGAQALVGKKVTLRTKAGPRKGKVEDVTEAGVTLATEIRAGRRVVGSTTFMVAWRDLTPRQEERLAKAWDAKGADGSIARAFLALAREDLAAARKAADAAGDHLLTGYVRRKIGAPVEGARRGPERGPKTGAFENAFRAGLEGIAAGHNAAATKAFEKAISAKPTGPDSAAVLNTTYMEAMRRFLPAAKVADWAKAGAFLKFAGLAKPNDPDVSALTKWLKVASKPLFFEDFARRTLSHWEIEHGPWRVEPGHLSCLIGSTDGKIFIRRLQLKDFILVADVMSGTREVGFSLGVYFRYTPGRHLLFTIRDQHNSMRAGTSKDAEGVTIRHSNGTTRRNVETGRNYRVTIRCAGEEFECYVDGDLISRGTDEKPAAGKLGLHAHRADGRFDNVGIYRPVPLPKLRFISPERATQGSTEKAANRAWKEEDKKPSSLRGWQLTGEFLTLSDEIAHVYLNQEPVLRSSSYRSPARSDAVTVTEGDLLVAKLENSPGSPRGFRVAFKSDAGWFLSFSPDMFRDLGKMDPRSVDRSAVASAKGAVRREPKHVDYGDFGFPNKVSPYWFWGSENTCTIATIITRQNLVR